ncbi:MAG TPA: hypothetical protein VFH56_09320 [Acidimicrobiales bacterium]|nr:hypothetical protein [Acidimicrobiales bacterium]
MRNGRPLSLKTRALFAVAAAAAVVPGTSVLSVAAGSPSATAAAHAHTAGNGGPGVTSGKAAGATSRISHVQPRERSSEQPPLGSGTSASTVATVVGAAPTADGRGFFMAWSNGQVTTVGDATWHGDMAGHWLSRPIVGIAATPTGLGYWLLGGDGGVFTFGDGAFYGSTGGMRLNAPALQMVSTHDGRGYDFVAGDGGVFTFGDAAFYGSTGGQRLNKPVVGMAMTPAGNGYWLVAQDGGVFTFGAAGFHGSTGGMVLNQPVIGMAGTRDGNGYWLVARDGGIFTFGDAPFYGSGVNETAGFPAVSVVATGDGAGYWIILSNGRVLSFGDATAFAAPVAASSPSPSTDNNYAYEVTNGAGQPARWNPCDALHYAVVSSGAPTGWQNDVTNDINQVSAATGISFVNDGTYSSTSAVPSSSKIVLSWVPSLSSSGGDTIGLTTYWYYNTSGFVPQMASAQIQLLTSLKAGGGYSGEQPVLLHELGHAMGLAHVNAAEVMNPVDQGYGSYMGGDLNGLWHLGASQGCANFYQ